jgi:hypothetical protein
MRNILSILRNGNRILSLIMSEERSCWFQCLRLYLCSFP